MSDAELEAKFRGLAAHGAPAIAGGLLAALRMIEAEIDAASVVKKAATKV
jgi:hypothetical protein